MFGLSGEVLKGVLDKLDKVETKIDSIEDRLVRVETKIEHVDEKVTGSFKNAQKVGIGLLIWMVASGGLKFETLYKIIPGLNGQPSTVQPINK